MKLINTLMPTSKISAADMTYLFANMNHSERAKFTEKWHFDNRVYAKIYFKCWPEDSYNDDEDFWKSVICKSKDYIKMRTKVNSVSDYIVEFYTDKDFEINSIWEKIF